jgi:hypothetical protein
MLTTVMRISNQEYHLRLLINPGDFGYEINSLNSGLSLLPQSSFNEVESKVLKIVAFTGSMKTYSAKVVLEALGSICAKFAAFLTKTVTYM